MSYGKRRAEERREEKVKPRTEAEGTQRYEFLDFASKIDEAQKDEFMAGRKYFDLAEKASQLSMPNVASRLSNIGRVENEHYRILDKVMADIEKEEIRRKLL